MSKIYPNIDLTLGEFSQGGQHFERIEPGRDFVGPTFRVVVYFTDKQRPSDRESKWEIQPNGDNLPVLQKAALARPELPETLEEGRRVFVNKLSIPDVGGDRYTVRCAKLKRQKLFTLSSRRDILELDLTAWKKVWFTIYATDESHLALIPGLAEMVQEAFVAAYISMEHVPAEQIVDFPHSFAALHSQDIAAPETFPLFKAAFGGDWPELRRRPFHLMIVLVKRVGEWKVRQRLRYLVASQVGDQPDNYVRAARSPEGVWTVTFLPPPWTCPLDGPARAHVARARGAPYSFADTVQSLSCQAIGAKADLSRHIPSLVEDWPRFTLTLSGHDDLDLLSEILNEGHDLTFTVELDVVEHSSAGWNKGNGVVMSTHAGNPVAGEPAVPIPDDELQKLVTHEIGHAFGLVPNPLGGNTGSRIPGWKHRTQYQDHGGIGSHCSFNARPAHGTYEHDAGKGPLCLMFHTLDPQMGVEFCDDCLTFLRQRSLMSQETRRMRWELFGR